MFFKRFDIAREQIGVFFGFHHSKPELLFGISRKIFLGGFPSAVLIAVIFGGIAVDVIAKLGYDLVLALTAKLRHIMKIYFPLEIKGYVHSLKRVTGMIGTALRIYCAL